jgi:hypothetical protein
MLCPMSNAMRGVGSEAALDAIRRQYRREKTSARHLIADGRDPTEEPASGKNDVDTA